MSDSFTVLRCTECGTTRRLSPYQLEVHRQGGVFIFDYASKEKKLAVFLDDVVEWLEECEDDPGARPTDWGDVASRIERAFGQKGKLDG